jgi:hypothetical protein
LPVELKNQNQDLSRQYAVKGFPTVLFLDAEGKEIGRMGYKAGGVVLYLEAIKAKIPQAESGTKEAAFPSFPSLKHPVGP